MNIGGILKLIEWYFEIYNGAEGKLTVAAHKIIILKVDSCCQAFKFKALLF